MLKGDSSFYYNHFKIQPQLDNLPIYFDHLDRQFLLGSKFIDFIDTELQEMKNEFKVLEMYAPEFIK